MYSRPLADGQRKACESVRLIDLLTRSPRVTMAAVVAAPVAGAPWSLQLHATGPDTPARATLQPLGLELAPQVHHASRAAGRRRVDLRSGK